ncbi:hypothetical protein RhiirB3_485684 [Rhizophagus irregularis]|nr:hypothetical protein RhiirB3_485684 [Rhizophagus irregularis]
MNWDTETLIDFLKEQNLRNTSQILEPQIHEIQDDNKVAWKKFWEAEDLICITEDKQYKVPVGFAQNIKQLESTCETNKRKRKRGDDNFDYVYGIVTTVRNQHFLLYSPGKISKASDTAYLIEFTKKALDSNFNSYQLLRNIVKEVLGIIVDLLKDRACAEEEPERKKIIKN